MDGTTFGQPIATGVSAREDAQEASSRANSTASVSNAPQDVLDPNDPRLTSELLDANLEGDAYATPPPPPDGKYRAKLKLERVKDKQGAEHDYLPTYAGKNQTPCLYTSYSASIIDPSGKYDGIRVFEHWASTLMGRDGSTKVSTVLSRLHRPDGQPWVAQGERLSQRDWMERLVKALAGEPEVVIETQWGWNCQQCTEAAKKRGERGPREVLGMAKFPPSKDRRGEHVPEMACASVAAHGYSRAQVRIAGISKA